MVNVNAAKEAMNRRDLVECLKALDIPPYDPLVWPETYPLTYHYQRLGYYAEILGMESSKFPVVMRSAKTSLFYKYGKSGYIARVVDRYLAVYRVTKIDDSAWGVAIKLAQRIEQKHNICFRLIRLFDKYRGAVIVEGRTIPMNRQKLREIEKAMDIINKLDKLAA